jgi:hypothetical protein
VKFEIDELGVGLLDKVSDQARGLRIQLFELKMKSTAVSPERADADVS